MAWRTRLSDSGGWVELMLNSTVREDGTLTTRVFRPSAMDLTRSGGRLVTMSASRGTETSNSNTPSFLNLMFENGRCCAS